MRRLTVFVMLVAVVLGILVGCGNPKPNDRLSADAVAALEAAIETLDSFLAYDISAEEAEEKLERIAASLETSGDTYDNIVELAIFNTKMALSRYDRYESFGSAPDDYDGIKGIREDRERLHDLLYGK